MTRALVASAGLLVAVVLAQAGCERETRHQELPAAANRDVGVRLTSLEPGSPQGNPLVTSPYQNNAWGLSEGKRLYGAFNCTGCHGLAGGGAIGPALMDDKWIYGSQPDQIFSSISQGRPDGMPSFGGHIPTQQIWQLVAYVESMSGQVPQDAAPSRSDAQSVAKPESRIEREPARQTGHR
ncbi:MAG: cytochrome C [Acidobacteria bacterium]|nr:MAG: cytochrome C [Acidobacteriota bacterium]